jgi:hypothetical protein
MWKLPLLSLLSLTLVALDNRITIHDASGATQTARPYTVLMAFAQSEIPAGQYPKPRIGGATVPAAWQADLKSSWPDGSVMTAYISLPVTITANGSTWVDFVADASPCHLGSLAACQAAALDQSGMGAFLSGAWSAQIRGTANAITYTADAEAMIENGAWRYWLRGPVVTRVIVEDMTTALAYDFGWQYTGGAWAEPSTAAYRSAHPLFEISFYSGWAGVEIGYRLENVWNTKMQRLVFDLSFLKGSTPTAYYTKTAYNLNAKAAVTHYAWDGTTPGEVVVDRNLPYLVSTRIFPAYDTSIAVASSTITALQSSYDASVGTDDAAAPDPRSCTAAGACGLWMAYMPNSGDHGDFGILPKWYAAWLYAMGDSGFTVAARATAFRKMVVGPADAAATMPFHLRESYTTLTGVNQYLNYPDDSSTLAFGRMISVTAHPDGRFMSYDSSGAKPVVYVCTTAPCNAASTTHPWTVDEAHRPSTFAIPYLLTGRYTYLASMQEEAAAGGGTDHPMYGRNQGDGVLFTADVSRAGARLFRNLAWAYLLSPDSPERQYFASRLKRNDEAYEGLFKITSGHYAAQNVANCAGSYWGTATWTYNSTAWAWPTNGARKIFGLGQRISAAPSVTVNGVAKTVGVDGVDTGRDWYYKPGLNYIRQDSGAAALSSSDTLSVYGNYTGAANTYCFGRGLMFGMENPLNYFTHGSGESRFLDGMSATSADSPWMTYGYMGLHLGWFWQTRSLATGSGYAFDYVAPAFARHVIDKVLDPASNMYYSAAYHAPTVAAAGIISSWTDYMAAFNPARTLDTTIASGATSIILSGRLGGVGNPNAQVPGIVKIDSEYIRVCTATDNTPAGKSTLAVCAGGRGYWGSVAASHAAETVVDLAWRDWDGTLRDFASHTYPNLALNTLAQFVAVKTSLGTGAAAYQKMLASGTGRQGRTLDQRYVTIPRRDPSNVRAVGGAGALTLRYNAPDLAACTYTAAASLADSSDAGDTSDGGGPVARTVTVSGLSAGAVRYRVTCAAGRVIGAAVVQ